MSDLWSRRLRTLPWAPPVRYPELAASDEVALDVRRHPITLAMPALRTVLGIVVLAVDGASVAALIFFAIAVAIWSHQRLNAGPRMSLVIAAVPTALLLVASGAFQALLALGLLAWLAEDVADWYTDRLVVSRKRIYRLYGVFTTHAPSISLTAVTYIDPSRPLLGRLFGYGTILLDSAAQRDEPLSRLDHLPEADFVHVKILELRAAAMPKFPQLPGS